MVIVQIIGGLGNQMFQYAYAKALINNGYDVKIDIQAFDNYKLHGGYQLDRYTIDIQIAKREEIAKYYKNNLWTKVLKRLKINWKSQKIIKEENLLFNAELLSPLNGYCMEGYFQSEKYFFNIRDEILKNFIIKKNLSSYSNKIKNKIKNMSNSCSLHIRRGDYVSNSIANKVHGTCTLDYYYDAMNIIESKIGNVSYFIFSDDLEWVEKNFKIVNAVYIENGSSRIPHEDIYLMSLCEHNIIANSSFSWWGAWINSNVDKIVIAPQRWFLDSKLAKQSVDITCENWIKL